MQSFAYLYMMAVGFAAAGLLASFVQLVSGKPLSFTVEANSGLASLGGVILRAVAGPIILIRNAWHMTRLRTQSPAWFGLSAAIAAGWSLLSGTFFLSVIFSL